jgi:hypothetical protein
VAVERVILQIHVFNERRLNAVKLRLRFVDYFVDRRRASVHELELRVAWFAALEVQVKVYDVRARA